MKQKMVPTVLVSTMFSSENKRCLLHILFNY
jgi:hypothetical protein